MEEQIRIHSTKTMDTAFGDALRAAGFLYEEADFIDTFPQPFILPQSYLPEDAHAVVFTSTNAVRAIAPHAESVTAPIFCLQGKTREAVEALFGPERIAGTAPHAAALAQGIIGSGRYSAVTFFCGRKRHFALPEMLREAGLSLREVEVYETVPAPVAFEEIPHALLFFSPGAAEYYFWENILDPLTIVFATGETTAAKLREMIDETQPLIIAAEPGADAMLQSLFTHYKINPLEQSPE